MRALIRSTSWNSSNPGVHRVELELEVSRDNSAALKTLVGNHVYVYGESRWRRFLNYFRRTE